MMKKAALWYYRRGFPVFPVAADGSKAPLVKWKKLHSEMPTEEEVKEWFKRFPDANISLACGSVPDVTVVDCDSWEAIEKIESILPDSLKMPIVETPRGGRHYYFRFTPGLKNWTGVFHGVDIRTTGGQVLLPPSVKGEKKYRWLDGLAIHQVVRPAMPEALRQAILGAKKKDETVYSERKTEPGAYGAAALAKELAALSMASKGKRNSTLNRAAHSLGQLVSGGELDVGQVETALMAAAVSIGLTTAEANATIRSGFAAGMARPRKSESKTGFKIADKFKKYRRFK